MANPLAIVLHASAAETVSGQSAPIDIGSLRSALRLNLELTELSGAGASILATIETSVSAGTIGWSAIGTISASTSPDLTLAGAKRYVRARWAIGGATPSVTFALSGAAHVLYAQPADIDRFCLPSKALASLDQATIADALLSATDEADGYFAAGYTLPLKAWGDDVRRMVAKMAALTAMTNRGFQPGGSDDLIVKGYDDAVAWCRRVGQHAGIEPPGIIDSTQNVVYEGGASVSSDPPRGGSFW